MKKVLFYIALFTILLTNISVKAKYLEYKSGDGVIIGGEYYVVVEDSNASTEKLKIMPSDSIMISNIEEIEENCMDLYYDSMPKEEVTAYSPKANALMDNLPMNSNLEGEESSTQTFMQCMVQHAKFCTSEDDSCDYLQLPFDTKELDEDEELVYDENSETNIGYFFKNKLDSYYKNLLGYNSVKTRLLTADEQINYMKMDMQKYGRIILEYGRMQDNCFYGGGIPNLNVLNKSNPVVVGNDTEGYDVFGDYMVNSLKYSKSCLYLTSGYYGNSVYTDYYINLFNIRPLIEISKKEFAYGLTKEKVGEGILELEVTNDNIKVGNTININGIPYMIIGIENNQVRLLAQSPVKISNYEIYDTCDSADNDVDYANCIIEHAKYCKNNEEDCYSLDLPYNYDDISNHTYNPNKVTNVGHYIKNELKDVIEEQIGINVIDVDILKNSEFEEIMDTYSMILPIGPIDPSSKVLEGLPQFEVRSTSPKADIDLRSTPYYLPFLLNYNDVLDQMDDDDISDFGYILPVITVSIDDMPVEIKASSTVKITTEPSEGYELVELKVTDDDNNKVIYTPEELVRFERGNYTFKMPSANTHVYAKYVPKQYYTAKSLSEELTLTDASDILSGTIVKYAISLDEGDTLEKIVYYDEENNEVEIPYDDKGNGDYEFTMPSMNLLLRAVINYAKPVYNLYGKDVTIPVQKSEEGGTLTFTVNGTKKIDKIVYKDEDGNELHPYYSLNNGTYSVIMPANDVYVEISYLDEVIPTPDKEEQVPTPITGDNIIKSVTILTIGLIIFMTCVVTLKKRKPKKKVLIPYDMV